MTIASYGYAGLIAPNDVWANMQLALGARYWVNDPTECVVSGLVGGTRQVQISPGWLAGWGVLDNVTAAETVTLPTVPAGSTHWFVIVARRTWQTTQATSFTYVTCGASLPKLLPNTLNAQPGVIDDQPLAIVSLASTDTVPTLVYDLRACGGKDNFWMSPDLADKPNWLNYMAYLGNVIRTGNKVWTRAIDPVTGNAYWDVDPEIVRAGPNLGDPLNTSSAAGWSTVGSQETRASRSGNTITMIFQASRTGASLQFSPTQGNVLPSDNTVITIGNTAWRPPYTIPMPFTYYADSGASYGGTCQYNPNGTVVITCGAPDTNIGKKTDGGLSFRAVANWTRQS